ncbi:MAG: amino acid adenylation domain-containing protein, partial [Deltaproteobacteria bacterium]|nr:amino acid adenylation domain-containing protein [Deltaproteobacteria bacterium]
DEDTDDTVRRWLEEEEAVRPFDLATGPLTRFTLLELAHAHHVLVISVHHIAVDGWSVGILIRELSELYNAILRGVEWQSEPALSYRDYLRNQEALQDSPEMQEHEAYWLSVYRDLPSPIELPTDRPRPPRKSYSSQRRTVPLPPALAQQVLEVSARSGTTPFGTMLAAYVALLARLGRSEDIAVGIPVAARSPDEGWNLVGYCTNMLPLRCTVDASSSFGELIGRVRDSWLDGAEHQDLPLSGLIRKLGIPFDLATPPLVSVLFNLDHAPSAPSLEGLRTRWVSSPIRHAVYDLFINVIQHDGSFTLECDASCDLFDVATVDRNLGMYLRLLEAGLADPAKAIADLPLLTANQRRLLAAWNETSVEGGEDSFVHEIFAETARRCPEAVAVVDGPRRLTYSELDERADRLAGLLRSRGAGADTAVGVCMPRSLEMIVGILAVLKAGGAYLPLDPTHPPERLRYMLTASEVKLVLVDGGAPARLPDTGEEVIAYDADQCVGDRVTGVKVLPHHLAYVMYTSGSTGKPKGAMVEHRNLVNLVRGLRQRVFDRYEGPLRVTLVASVVFDASVQQIFSALLLGHELWIVPDEVREDGESLASFFAENRIDVADGTPTHLRMLVEAAGGNGQALGPRHLIIGGEEMPAATARELFRRYPERPPLITNIYGPTECCVDSTAFDLSAASVVALDRVPIGTPMVNQRVHILDGRMHQVPIGAVGEIWIGGESVGRGYHHNEALTSERFIDGNAIDPGLIYRTGDLGRWRSDGSIDFLGRIDHLVKIRGYRVELGEIENALLDFEGPASPVQAAVVTVRTDPAGHKTLCAYLVATRSLSQDTLRRHLAQHLPDYMIPSQIVMVEEMPLTTSGKIDRSALPEPEALMESDGSHAPPSTPTEELVAGIWCEVLGIPAVGRTDSFFDLGGHSISAIQVVVRIRDLFDLDLPMRLVFEHPELADLCDIVEGERRSNGEAAAPPLLRDPTRGEAPLSFSQQRLWFLDQLEGESAAYNVPGALRIRGPLDVAALERAVLRIVQRHETLRTTFPEQGGKPVQIVAAEGKVALDSIALTALPRDEQEAEVRRRAASVATTPFDLSRGPLILLELLALDDEEHVLLTAMHHIVSDGWSFGVFARELAALYGTSSEVLPELAIQYSDWARWERGWLSEETLQPRIAYW